MKQNLILTVLETIQLETNQSATVAVTRILLLLVKERNKFKKALTFLHHKQRSIFV